MIDQILRRKSVKSSVAILEIDKSWKNYISNLTRGFTRIPFTGQYNCIVKEDRILIEAWKGDLVINKIYDDGETYLIVNPYKKKNFIIYAVYNLQGQFECFVTDPTWGFHYSGLTNYGMKLCLGDITFKNPDSLDTLKELGKDIARNLSLINMHSLGSIYERSRKNALLTSHIKARLRMRNNRVLFDKNLIQKML